VSAHGKLKKSGNHLVDAHNVPFELRGIGTHHMLEYQSLYTDASIKTLKMYGVNCIRLTAYLKTRTYSKSNGYPARGYLVATDETKEVMDNLIQLCIDNDMYCIVDWHVLGGDGDVTDYTTEAVDFFDYFADKWHSYPNIMYEILNEPFENSPAECVPFAQATVAKIRDYDPNAVIICGINVQEYGIAEFKTAFDAAGITDIFYSFHIYIGDVEPSGYESVFNSLDNAIENYPFFMTEWGNSEASGDGTRNDELAAMILDYLHDNCVPHCFWKWTYQNMTTAVLKYKLTDWNNGWYGCGGYLGEDLSPNGKLFFHKFRDYMQDEHITRT
jgi:endoglucanase